MDIEKFRSQWEDPEFERSFAQLDQEPPSAIVKRLQRMHEHARRWRRIRRIIQRAPFAVFLGLALLRLYIVGGVEPPLQTVAFILEMAALFGLNLVDKAREKYEVQKLWLSLREFIQDEHRRMNGNIRLDQWTSVLLSVAVACVGRYAAPLLSAGPRLACLAVTGAAVIVLQLYECRKISRLKRSRDSLAAQLDDMLRE